MDFVKIKKTPCVLLKNDLTGFYDRTIPIIENLLARTIGLPEGPTKSFCQALTKSWHKLMTSLEPLLRCFMVFLTILYLELPRGVSRHR